MERAPVRTFHGNLPETPTSLSMMLALDTHDFRPWHFDEITLLMTDKANAQSELHRRVSTQVVQGRLRLRLTLPKLRFYAITFKT